LGIAVVWTAFQAVVNWFEAIINFKWHLNVNCGLACGANCGVNCGMYPTCGQLAVHLYIVATYFLELLSIWTFRYYCFNEIINFSYIFRRQKIINDVANFN